MVQLALHDQAALQRRHGAAHVAGRGIRRSQRQINPRLRPIACRGGPPRQQRDQLIRQGIVFANRAHQFMTAADGQRRAADDFRGGNRHQHRLLDDTSLDHGLDVVDVPLPDQERLRKLADRGLPLRNSPRHLRTRSGSSPAKWSPEIERGASNRGTSRRASAHCCIGSALRAADPCGNSTRPSSSDSRSSRSSGRSPTALPGDLMAALNSL